MGACSIDKFCNLEPNKTNKINTSNCRFSKLCKPNLSPDFTFHKPIKQQQQYNNNNKDKLWEKIREEAIVDARKEPILRQHYEATVLSQVCLESAVASLLASKLSSESLSKTALFELFYGVIDGDRAIGEAARDDLRAAMERDPACLSYVHCFLNFKGFHACQAHRLAHKLWAENRTAVAALIQARASEVFGVDIHPGATIGRGIVIDHATGVVIGETAVIGNNVTILHGVTLGGTGKIAGDRHPKIGNGVFIGAGTKILGCIRIGDNARIGAGSVVLKDVPSNTTAVGNPARLIGGKD